MTGEIALGPYEFLNTTPLPGQGEVRPALVLRCSSHLEAVGSDMTKTSAEFYHGAPLPEEVASLASLVLGVRLRAGGATRMFEPNGDPKGRPIEFYSRPPNSLVVTRKGYAWILPRVVESQCPVDQLNIMSSLPTLGFGEAIALIRSARLYQDALWLAESEPSLAWLLFVSSLENAAGEWKKSKAKPEDRLKGLQPELYQYLQGLGPEVPAQVANFIADMLGSTKKFVDFVMEFLPPAPSQRPPQWLQLAWAGEPIRESLRKIYKYRSKALHEGRPFPYPMCESPANSLDWPAVAEIPNGYATSYLGGTWLLQDTPMLLHTFEYITRNALLAWWRAIAAPRPI
jgi:hypothetical protein